MAALRNLLLDTARELIGNGYPVILLKPNERTYAFKSPHAMDLTAIRHWTSRRAYNLGIFLTGSPLMVCDCDSEQAIGYAERNSLVSRMAVRTRRGMQYYLTHDLKEPSNKQGFDGQDLDLLWNAATPVPPTEADGRKYEFENGIVPVNELPMFPKRLLKSAPVRPLVPLVTKDHRSLLRYIGHIISESGSGGHKSAFRCACKIASVIDDPDEALAVFMAWNETNAIPPFNEKDCRHKISEAYKFKRLDRGRRP